MCRRSLRGNREIPRLTSGNKEPWFASGRRGAVADDVRVREVRLRHISWEADEQGGAIRCGVGGAKGGGQGEYGSAKHVPGTGPGKRVTGAGPHTASGKAQEEGEVHRALPPYHRPAAPGGVLRTQGECRSRSGRAEMGRIRGGSRAQARRSARTTPAGSVSGAAGPARVHTQVRRAAPARGCRPGRQNRPEGDCRSAKRDL